VATSVIAISRKEREEGGKIRVQDTRSYSNCPPSIDWEKRFHLDEKDASMTWRLGPTNEASVRSHGDRSSETDSRNGQFNARY